MGEFLEAILALIGLGTLIVSAGRWLIAWLDEQETQQASPEPYQQALDTTARINAAAFGAEKALHEAARDTERKRRT